MARTQHQDSTNRIEDKSSLIRTDQEVHRSSRPDHSLVAKAKAEKVVNTENDTVVNEA